MFLVFHGCILADADPYSSLIAPAFDRRVFCNVDGRVLYTSKSKSWDPSLLIA